MLREWDGQERRTQRTPNKELVAEIVCAIQETHKPLSDDEQQWVRLAIQREAQSIKLRQAIIEKTLGGLAWAAIVGLGWLLLDAFKNHK